MAQQGYESAMEIFPDTWSGAERLIAVVLAFKLVAVWYALTFLDRPKR